MDRAGDLFGAGWVNCARTSGLGATVYAGELAGFLSGGR